MSKKSKTRPYRKLKRKKLERECEALAEISARAIVMVMQKDEQLERALALVEETLALYRDK